MHVKTLIEFLHLFCLRLNNVVCKVTVFFSNKTTIKRYLQKKLKI